MKVVGVGMNIKHLYKTTSKVFVYQTRMFDIINSVTSINMMKNIYSQNYMIIDYS